MMKPETARIVNGVFRYTAAGLLVCIVAFPILWLMRMSVVPGDLVTRLPPPIFFKWQFDSFATVFEEQPFVRYLINSLTAAVFSTAVAMVIGLPAAYSFARFHFKGAGLLLLSVLFLYVMPPIGMVMPFYVIFSKLGLIDTRIALVITHSVITLPLSIWLLRGFFARIPIELEEAAMIDGCTRLEALVRVIIPPLAPGLAATAVLSFLYSWNDFLYAATLTGLEARTLPVMITGFITNRAVYWDRIAAAGTIVLLPPLIFGMLVQRYLAEGLSAGAVKE